MRLRAINSQRTIITVAVVVLVGLLSLPQSAEARCGKERWAVKTGTDSDAQLVDTAVHNVTRIAAMRSWPAPDHLPATKRIAPFELKVWVVPTVAADTGGK